MLSAILFKRNTSYWSAKSHVLGKKSETMRKKFTRKNQFCRASDSVHLMSRRRASYKYRWEETENYCKIEDLRYVKMKRVMTTIPYLMILWLTSMLKPFSHAVRGYSCIGIYPGPEEITARYGQFCRYSLACTKRKCMDSIYFHFFGPSNMLSQGYCTCSDRRLHASKLSHWI